MTMNEQSLHLASGITHPADRRFAANRAVHAMQHWKTYAGRHYY